MKCYNLVLKDIITLKISLIILKVCHYLRNIEWVPHLNTNYYSMRYRCLKIRVWCHKAEIWTAAYVLRVKVSRLTQRFQNVDVPNALTLFTFPSISSKILKLKIVALFWLLIVYSVHRHKNKNNIKKKLKKGWPATTWNVKIWNLKPGQ